MDAGIKATGGGTVAPKEGDRGEGSGNQQGSDVYLECYVPEDGPDLKETVVIAICKTNEICKKKKSLTM